ncbi:hypothetical protein TEU_04610 [Thermococcus eurythermalis]|uniref:Uncharacterized protein n=1 Tax=Thermococcus eurythermalis TaxID=1505907 RepID=A0A097QT74_9EURY|nr:hypothetical protein [Thermococcus eurythermalis]AIU69674.1 hypothetical protein TEU_04610 [Thermococcus eurythermalis]
MGQKIVVNGQAKQLPRVFRDERELREFLDEVVKRALKDPDYARKFNGGGKVVLTVDLKKLGINVEGIDEVELVFLKKKGSSNYYLKTAYPTRGNKVLEYREWSGEWIVAG